MTWTPSACYLGEERIEMGTEEEMDRLFPDCERGAIPPFGSVYHLPTLVDESLAEDEQIVFEAHNHEEAIRMAYRDFEALEHRRKGQNTADVLQGIRPSQLEGLASCRELGTE